MTKQIKHSDNVLDLYPIYRAMTNRPVPNRHEAAALARRIQAGDDQALEELVAGNSRFAVNMAARYHRMVGKVVAMEDLMQESLIALTDAARRFDPDSGNNFLTYAVFWIKSHVHRYLAKMRAPVKAPDHTQNIQRKVMTAIHRLEQRGHQFPIPEQIAEESGLTVKGVEAVLVFRASHVSLDMGLGGKDDDHTRLIELLQAEPEQERDTVENEQLLDMIMAEVGAYDERMPDILRRRYGLDGDEPQTLDQVGDDYGVTRERIRQIQERAEDKIRTAPRFRAVQEAMAS